MSFLQGFELALCDELSSGENGLLGVTRDALRELKELSDGGDRQVDALALDGQLGATSHEDVHTRVDERTLGAARQEVARGLKGGVRHKGEVATGHQ